MFVQIHKLAMWADVFLHSHISHLGSWFCDLAKKPWGSSLLHTLRIWFCLVPDVDCVWMNFQFVHSMHSIFGSAYLMMEEAYQVDIETSYSIRFDKGKLLSIPAALLVEDMGKCPNSHHLVWKHGLKFSHVWICDLAGSERRHFPQAVCDQLHHQ